MLSRCQALCQVLHVHDLLILTATLPGISLLHLCFTGWRNWAQDGWEILVRKWWSRDLFRAGSPPPEPSVLGYSTLFLRAVNRAVSGWTRWPHTLYVPLWCPQCAVSETAWENCMKFFIRSPLDMIRRFGRTFYTYQSHQRLNNTYEYQFLNLQGQIQQTVRQMGHGLTWPEHRFSVGEPGKPFYSRVDGKCRVCSGGLIQQGSWMYPSFLKVRRAYRVGRAHLHLPSPAEKYWQILTFALFFSMGTSILLLWHYHRLIWLISAQFISDYLFFSVWWDFGGVLLISNRLTNHLFR